jgi:aspartate aminotransferase-like enzyme
MGYNARPENAYTVLGALERVLSSQGYRVPPGVGVEAARAFAVAPAVPA